MHQARFKLRAAGQDIDYQHPRNIKKDHVDRLMHNVHRLPLKGESMRKILGQLTEREHLL